MSSISSSQPLKRFGLTDRREESPRSLKADEIRCEIDNDRQKCWSEAVKLDSYGGKQGMRKRDAAQHLGRVALRELRIGLRPRPMAVHGNHAVTTLSPTKKGGNR